MASLAEVSKSDLAKRLSAAGSRLRNLREKSAKVMRRGAIGLGAVGGGYGAGWVDGWAEANGKDMTIGENGPRYDTIAATGAVLLGVLGEPLIGETGADLALGVGAGAAGYRAGAAGRAAAMKG